MPSERLLLSCASSSGWLARPGGTTISLAGAVAPGMTKYTGLTT